MLQGLCPGSLQRLHAHLQAVGDPGASWELNTSCKAGSPQPSLGDWHASLIWEAFTATCRLSAKEKEENKSKLKNIYVCVCVYIYIHTHIHIHSSGVGKLFDLHLFSYGPGAKNGFYLFKALLKYTHMHKEDCVPQTVYGLQNLKYLLSGPIQKKFTNPQPRPILLA